MKVTIVGAGRSAGSLIIAMNEYCRNSGNTLLVCDAQNPEWLRQLGVTFRSLDIQNDIERNSIVAQSDIVISLLPPSLHILLVQDCIQHKKHFLNASYLSTEIEALKSEIDKTGCLFLVECGLDPGIDHMSALEKTHQLIQSGYSIQSFKSFTGGLVAPESDTNPWHYKVSWNPRNVVLAGQGTARFREGGSDRLVPYHQLFSRLFEFKVQGLGEMDGYANRDSLSYMPLYGMENVDTFIRGTLRYRGYCQAWNLLVQLGLTDDTVSIPTGITNWEQLLNSFLPSSNSNIETRLKKYLQVSDSSLEWQALRWLLLDNTLPIRKEDKTPAMALQSLLETKWKLQSDDLDMIVMQHEWEATGATNKIKVVSSLVLKGKNTIETAMAQTVGLPLFIAAKRLMESGLHIRGLHRPTLSDLYTPILSDLSAMGISFSESEEKS